MSALHESWMAAYADRGRESSAQRLLLPIRGDRSLAAVTPDPRAPAPRERRLDPVRPGSEDPSAEGPSRWITALVVVVVVLVILTFVVLHLSGTLGPETH
jgi:hypothetical protein